MTLYDFHYVDNRGKIQGPFSATTMHVFYTNFRKYMRNDLIIAVRNVETKKVTPTTLGQMIAVHGSKHPFHADFDRVASSIEDLDDDVIIVDSDDDSEDPNPKPSNLNVVENCRQNEAESIDAPSHHKPTPGEELDNNVSIIDSDSESEDPKPTTSSSFVTNSVSDGIVQNNADEVLPCESNEVFEFQADFASQAPQEFDGDDVDSGDDWEVLTPLSTSPNLTFVGSGQEEVDTGAVPSRHEEALPCEASETHEDPLLAAIGDVFRRDRLGKYSGYYALAGRETDKLIDVCCQNWYTVPLCFLIFAVFGIYTTFSVLFLHLRFVMLRFKVSALLRRLFETLHLSEELIWELLPVFSSIVVLTIFAFQLLEFCIDNANRVLLVATATPESITGPLQRLGHF